MRSCPHCGVPSESGAHFCGNCGQLVEPESHAATMADPDHGQPHGASRMPATGALIGREIIGQYIITRKLGEGGMGEVYHADQPSIGRAVAIKVLHPHLTRGGDTAQRFQQEARAAARLQSPHIVQIFNYGDMGEGAMFMAMEYLAGRTLAELIRAEAPLEPGRAVKIARQCCEALQEAHEAGIVHRDLKPSNLMLVERSKDPEFVKVLDFGVAKLEGGAMTQEGAMLGTPQYMSPEQLRSEAIDGRSDLYALGVILYEMLGTRPPFEARTPVGYVNMHLNEAPMPITARVGSIPPALAAVVMQTLEKDPAARPQSAAELSDMLAAAISGVSPMPWSPSPQPSFGPHASAPPPYTPSHAEPITEIGAGTIMAPPTSSPASSSSPALWVLAAVAIVAVLGGVGALTYLDLEGQSSEAGARLAAIEEKLDAQRTGEVPEGSPPASPDGSTAASPDGSTAASPDGSPPASPSTDPAPPQPPSLPPSPPSLENDEPPPPPPQDTRPLRELSPETEGLLALSIPELERKLERRLDNSLIPPSSRAQIREALELQKRMTPSGGQGDAQLKSTLVQYINSYDNPSIQAKPGDKLPLKKLEQVFMTMEMKNELEPEMRETVLNQAMSAYDDHTPAEDVEFLKRIALANMIRTMARDPKIID